MLRGTICLLLSAATFAAAADLPVKQVILYKNGVGHFTRAGEIPAGENVRLDFKADEMNDILKTLTVSAQGGGVEAVRYDSDEPLQKKLGDFGFRVGPQQSLGLFLDQFKGARIEARVGTETVTGTILSGRLVAATAQLPERQEVLLLTGGGVMQTLDLGSASSFRFTDDALQKKLVDYLGILAGARNNDLRSLVVQTEGSGAKQVTLGYLEPSPVWKSTYRLLFGANGQATLEGWAIVDNTTGEDWKNISLAMMSGRPVSFVMNLYEPEYRNRPTAQLPEDEAVKPQLYGGVVGGVAQAPPAPAAKSARRLGAMAEMVEPQSSRQDMAAVAGDANLAASYSVASSTAAMVAAAREAGELFEYRIPRPVTILKGESAMLPFTQGPVSVRRLVVYSDRSSEFPRNAAEISNSTGKTLDGGPIAIYDGGAYAGEALMETLKKGDERLISYAVDIGTRITTDFGTRTTDVQEVHFRRGILETRRSLVRTTTYTIKNVDAKAKTLVIEQPATPGAELVEPKTAGKTANAYRFEVALPASADKTLAVVEQLPISESHAVTSLTPDVLLSYVSNKSISDKARASLQQIAAQKRQIADNDNQIARAESDIRNAEQDEQRLRSNISTLRSVAGQQEQVQQYASQLAALEGRIVSLRDQLAELRNKKAALESELNTLIEILEF